MRFFSELYFSLLINNHLNLTRALNRLALGTVQFGLPYGIANQTGQVSRAEAKAMLQLAATQGIDTLDTAIAYGDSESCLGEVGTKGFKLVTKLPAFPESCSDIDGWVKKQFSGSRTRLGVSTLYGLMLHRPDQLMGSNGNELYSALQRLKESGKVRKIGVSIYAPSELEAVTKNFPIDIIQAPFNLLDRRFHATGWLHRLKSEGVEIHTRSAFLQGLLLITQADLPVKFAPWNGLLKKWNTWLSEHNISALSACLAFPLAFPEIDRIVVGADNFQQLKQLIEAANHVVPNQFPDINCTDEFLINPSLWNCL
jgi:aryl-alcohol dehydrogenase-like predicted oxidoreductase